MVQYLSLQKGGVRSAASMHEPVHGRLSIGRVQTEIARAWSWQRVKCRRLEFTHVFFAPFVLNDALGGKVPRYGPAWVVLKFSNGPSACEQSKEP